MEDEGLCGWGGRMEDGCFGERESGGLVVFTHRRSLVVKRIEKLLQGAVGKWEFPLPIVY